VLYLTSTPTQGQRVDAGDQRLARSRGRNYWIGFHEIQILSHCIDLVIKFAGEGNNFGDECLAPDGRFGQMNVLVSEFWKVSMETDSFGILTWVDKFDLEMRFSPNHGIESRPVSCVLDQRNTGVSTAARWV
jgi:hypothetical protein